MMETLAQFNRIYIITVVLIGLWFLGIVSAFTLGGYIHIFLALAIVLIITRIVSARSVL